MAYWSIIDTGLSLLKRIVPIFIIDRRKDRFFDKCAALFMIAQQDGTIIEVNDAFARTLGYTKESLSGTKFMRLVHSADHAKTRDVMEELSIGAVLQWNFQNRYRKANGSYVILEWLASKNGYDEIYATARIIE